MRLLKVFKEDIILLILKAQKFVYCMTASESPKKVYICCRYCMEKNPELLIPCAKYRDGTDFTLQACPKKERNEPNSETLKPKWEKISKKEFSDIYNLSIALKANTNVILKNNEKQKLYKVYRKRVQNNNSST